MNQNCRLCRIQDAARGSEPQLGGRRSEGEEFTQWTEKGRGCRQGGCLATAALITRCSSEPPEGV